MTPHARIATLVAQVIFENTGRQLTLAPEDPLISSGYLDSMSMVSLVIALQRELTIELQVTDISADNFETVRAITEMVDGLPS